MLAHFKLLTLLQQPLPTALARPAVRQYLPSTAAGGMLKLSWVPLAGAASSLAGRKLILKPHTLQVSSLMQWT
jgi:hypothetical protein